MSDFLVPRSRIDYAHHHVLVAVDGELEVRLVLAKVDDIKHFAFHDAFHLVGRRHIVSKHPQIETGVFGVRGNHHPIVQLHLPGGVGVNDLVPASGERSPCHVHVHFHGSHGELAFPVALELLESVERGRLIRNGDRTCAHNSE